MNPTGSPFFRGKVGKNREGVSKALVRRQMSMKKNVTSGQGQVILAQHNIEACSPVERQAEQAILVPLDLAGLTIVHQERQPDGSLEIHVRASTDRAICPRCQTTCVKVHDTRPRRKRDIPVRDYAVCLVLYKRRFRCLTCHRSFSEPDSVCGRYKRTTRRFRDALGQQASRSTVTQVAHEAHTGTRFVQDCLTTWGQERLASQGRSLSETGQLSTPCFLGIDEFARRKGHHYDTLLCDLARRTVLEVSEGRTQDEVVKLLERLDKPDAVQAVSMDMSACYRPAVQLCLPHAQIVVDHFHVIQHVMKAFRKIVSSWAHKKEGKTLLQGKQHLFLMAQETLTQEQQQERATIGDALPKLHEAWQLKEALRTWYADSSAATAAGGLDTWIEQVRASDFAPLHHCLSAFHRWRQEILAFFQFLPSIRLSNGFVEGKNNRTKAIMRQGYGYRNRQHLRLRIFLADVR